MQNLNNDIIHSLIRKLLLSVLIFLFSQTGFAQDTAPFKHFNLNLPSTMHVEVKNEKEDGVNQYVFLSNDPTNDTYYQLRAIILGSIPERKGGAEEFELESLGAMIALFSQAYHLPLTNQTEALNQKPKVMTIDNHPFKYAQLEWENTQAQFYISASNGKVYMFTLSSTSKDKSVLTKNMAIVDELLKSIKLK